MKQKSLLLTGVAVVTAALSWSLNAQTTPGKATSPAMSPAPAATAATAATAASPAKPSRPIPFHGMVSAVDQTEKTFTITGKETSRVFKVTEKTEILKGGTAATMADITENAEVSGSYWKHPDDTLEAKKVKIGPRKEKGAMTSPAASPAATASPKASPKTKSSPKP